MAQTDYKALLANRMERDFSKWAAQGTLQESEVYRFLHTMKGTAGTIGMAELSDFCAVQLDSFSEHSTSPLSADSLEELMASFRYYFAVEEAASEETAEREMSANDPTSEEALILIIDPDAEYAAKIKETLEARSIPAVIALDGQKGMELFYTLHPQMVLVEAKLPDMEGFHLAERIAEAGRNRHLPVAIMREGGQIDDHIRAMEAGVTDFLAKPLNMAYFLPYLANRLRSQEFVLQAVRVDKMTGAGNRQSFDHALSQMANLAERTGKPFTLALLDLDHFKKINDSYGHPAGDEVLRSFSQLILDRKRESDQFFRYGGEEFALILPNTRAAEADAFIDRLRQALAETEFTVNGHVPVRLTFSAGLSEYRLAQETIVSKADQALYLAKRNGRNQTRVYEAAGHDVKRKLNIVIVDDDSLVRKLVAKQFSNWKTEDFDIHIEEYPDGLALVDSDWYRPDEHYMILLDGVMPKMDGLEVLSHVRSQYPHDNILVSMLTSRNNESDIVLALKSGADDYIVKPFYAQEVVARVQRLTKRMFK